MIWRPPTDRIRTLAEIKVETPLIDVSKVPFYQEIAPKVHHLHKLGMNKEKIKEHLKISNTTVRKAFAFIESLKADNVSPSADQNDTREKP